MPIIIRSKYGATFGIYTKESGHNSPHVTVKWSGKELILFFDGRAPVSRDHWSPREMRIILNAFHENQEELFNAWEEIHGQE